MLSAKYEYGHQVRLIRNVRNDGSVAGAAKGALLARRGEVGYVRHAGMFLLDQVVYQVHFLDRNTILGCRETELIDAALPWVYNRFEYGDAVELALSLSRAGHLLASKGTPVSVLGVYRDEQDGSVEYRVQLADQELILPERALQPANEEQVCTAS